MGWSFPPNGNDYHKFNIASGTTHLPVSVQPGEELKVILHWKQPYSPPLAAGPGSRADFDLYVVSDREPILTTEGNILAMSIDQQGNVDEAMGTPFEYVAYQPVGATEPQTVYVVIDHFDGLQEDDNIEFHLMIVGGTVLDDTILGDGTIFGHAAAANVMTVAAMDYIEIDSGGDLTPPLGVLNVEEFTASGAIDTRSGVPIAYSSLGEPLGDDAESRAKPDITSPDGTDTTFFTGDLLGGPDSEPNNRPNFFGTSAAAAHAAAVAALVREVASNRDEAKNLGPMDLSPAEMYAILKDTATPLDEPEHLAGAGLIDALAAANVANEPPPTPTPFQTVACNSLPNPKLEILQPLTADTVLPDDFSNVPTYIFNLDDENGNVIVPAGVTLTIRPGVSIYVNGDQPNPNFDVFGTLIVEGNGEPVTFASCDGYWGGIRIFSDENQDPSILENVIIRGGGRDASLVAAGTEESGFNAIQAPSANHSLRLSNLEHVVNNVTFLSCEGVPIWAEPPLKQSISGINVLDPVTSDQLEALAVGNIRGENLTRMTEDPLIPTPAQLDGGFRDGLFFPISAQFEPGFPVTFAAGSEINMGLRAVLRFRGRVNFDGTQANPITVSSGIPNANWGRVELLAPAVVTQRISNTVFSGGGAPAPLPLFNDLGSGRFFAGTSQRVAPGCAVLISEGSHEVSDIRIEDWRQLLFVQDIRVVPSYGGTIEVATPALEAPESLPAIGVFDLTLGRDEMPLVIPEDLEISPPSGATFLYNGSPMAPDFYFDRDVVVPRNFQLTLNGGNVLNHERLGCIFSIKETARSTRVTNFNIGKCEMIVAGALVARGTQGNRALFSSTDFTTATVSGETDFNETDFGKRHGMKSGLLADLLGDIDRMEKEKEESAETGKEAKVFSPHSLDWGGVFLTDDSDDLNTHLDYCEIHNAINGVLFLSSSGKLTNSYLTNCYGSGVVCSNNSFPLVAGNRIAGNGHGGISCSYNSSPYITRNEIKENVKATGVSVTDYSFPILTDNYIGANNIGVLIASGSVPNLGRVAGDPSSATQPDTDLDPGFDTDDGRNTIVGNNNSLGIIANIVNNTPSLIYAENNSWGTTNLSEIAQTIIDSRFTGTLPGVVTKRGLVDFIPLRTAPTPTPAGPSPTATPSPTRTPRPTSDPNLPTRTFSPTPIGIPHLTPTPTATVQPLPAEILSDRLLSGLVRVESDVTVREGVLVSVAPGTKVLVEGDYRITVEHRAKIVAMGTEANPIFFFAPAKKTWKGLAVVGPDDNSDVLRSHFQYCVFQRTNDVGLHLQDVTCPVLNCEFRDCATGLRLTGGIGTNPRVRWNTFQDNQTSVEVAVSGVLPAGTLPENALNLGVKGTNPDTNPDVDPGFNVFIQSAPPANTVDVAVTSFFSGKTFFAEENLFLERVGEQFFDLVEEAQLGISGRVTGLTDASYASDPIPTDATDTLVIAEDDVWGGVVRLTADRYTEVAENANLTILPGTRIFFDPDPSVSGQQPTLRVRGHLSAKGTQSKHILFASSNETNPTGFDWGGLEFAATDHEDTNPSVVQFAEIRDAAIGVTCYVGVKTVVRNTVVENCGETGIMAVEMTPEGVSDINVAKSKAVTSSPTLNKRGVYKADSFLVSRPLFERVIVLGGETGEFGVHSINAEPILRSCAVGVDPRTNEFAFRNFLRAGILVEGFRVPNLGTASDRGNNMIGGSFNPAEGAYELRHNSATPMLAVGNYWFAGGMAGVKDRVFDYDDNTVAGRVTVEPYLIWPPALDVPGGDLDADALFLPNDFVKMMRKAFVSIPSDRAYSRTADRDESYIIDYRDVFLLSLTLNERGTRPVRQFPRTPTPTATVIPNTPTPTVTVATNTPTPTLPVVPGTPTPTIPEIPGTPTSTVPGIPSTPTPTLPVIQNTPTRSPTQTFTPAIGTPTPTQEGVAATPTRTRTFTNTPTPVLNTIKVFPRRPDECDIPEDRTDEWLSQSSGMCGTPLAFANIFNGAVINHFADVVTSGNIEGTYRFHIWFEGAGKVDIRLLLDHRDGTIDILAEKEGLNVNETTEPDYINFNVSGTSKFAEVGYQLILQVQWVSDPDPFDTAVYYYGDCVGSDPNNEEVGFSWVEFDTSASFSGCPFLTK